MKGYIHNIVIGCPGATWDEYLQEGRALASFYAELLGMKIIREDWFKIAANESSSFNLAFGEGPGEYRPPRWPDPEYPQQMHLDILVNDLDTADRLVLGLGATPLQDKGEYRSYADPVGHPFCLYPDADQGDGPGRVGRVVIDCFSPRALAGFYAELLDMRTRVEDSPERVVIGKDDGTPMLAFQHALLRAPRWPDPHTRRRCIWTFTSTMRKRPWSRRNAWVRFVCPRVGAARSTPTPPRIPSVCARPASEAGVPICSNGRPVRS